MHRTSYVGSFGWGGIAGAYREPARSSSIRPCRPRMKIKLRASDSCERGHRHGEWALGSNVKLMAGIGVPVPSVNDGAIADRLGPPSESGRELQPRGFFTGFSPAPICRNWEGVGNAVRTEFITFLLCDYRGSTDDAHEPRDARISYLASRRRVLLLGGIAGYGIYPTNALA